MQPSLLQGLGRSAEERLRAERVRAMERLDQKRQLLEVSSQAAFPRG